MASWTPDPRDYRSQELAADPHARYVLQPEDYARHDEVRSWGCCECDGRADGTGRCEDCYRELGGG